MSWKRLGVMIASVIVVAGGAYSFVLRHETQRAQREQARAAQIPPPAPPVPFTPSPEPNQSWRWPTQSAWVVHQVVRQLASWALLAGNTRLEPAQIRVRRTDPGRLPETFAVELATARGPQTWSVPPGLHAWDASAYVDIARALMGPDGATPGEPVAGVSELLLASDTVSLRKADARLFGEMKRRPRDPRLHEQAALLWAAHALRESDGDYGDERPFLNGIAAHLALAHALRGAAPGGPDAEVAGVVLDALLLRQVEAMAALDRIAASAPVDSTKAWLNAVRLRVTHDPRLIPAAPTPSRLEQVEGVRALYLSQGCRQAMARARSWHLPLAADWTRAIVSGCSEPELGQLSQAYLELQASDAARLLDLEPGSFESTVDSLSTASAENTHQPARPASVVSRHLRADSGLRHVLSGFQLMVRHLRRLGLPENAKMLSAMTQSIREKLPQRPLLELSMSAASDERSAPREVCGRLARLVIDRPDLMTARSWGDVHGCSGEPALNFRSPFGYRTLLPGTALLGLAPWQSGPMAMADLSPATRQAPWDAGLAAYALEVAHQGDPPPAAVRQAYEKLLDYDIYAMKTVLYGLRDEDDDEVQRLAERVCEIDVEECTSLADYLSSLGRDEAAEKMWKRALADAQDMISLSNNLGRYVNLLLDRRRTDEALRIARRAANVYSAVGLFTLANAFERLGRFEDAAAEHAKSTQRYGNKLNENAFYLRYRHRHGGDRFAKEAELATAELFPHGLVRKTLEDFRQELRRTGQPGSGAIQAKGYLSERLRRVGVRLNDLVVAVDGFAVENHDQMSVILTFTDEPPLTLIVVRLPTLAEMKKGQREPQLMEISGQYRRWEYGLVTRPAPRPSVVARS